MDCIPCTFCNDKGAGYSYAEDASYILADHPELNSSLERLLTPIFNFRLFSGFSKSI